MSARVSKSSMEMPATTSMRKPNEMELRAWIEQAAYYRAEKRGFQPGSEVEDWVAAEAEVMARLRGGQSVI